LKVETFLILRNVFFSVDVRRPEAAQPDVSVLRSADNDAVARPEAVVTESRHEGKILKTIEIKSTSSSGSSVN
jgi:hypothetical protein